MALIWGQLYSLSDSASAFVFVYFARDCSSHTANTMWAAPHVKFAIDVILLSACKLIMSVFSLQSLEPPAAALARHKLELFRPTNHACHVLSAVHSALSQSCIITINASVPVLAVARGSSSSHAAAQS